MVTGVKIEGGTQILSAGVRKTIQQIKEIVANHSDADIYTALKETNMDPNETTQKLLNQDPFHEVKRKRDKKKENSGYNNSTTAEPRRNFEFVGQSMRPAAFSDRNVRRIGYSRNILPGVSREFRVVRDNRVNQTAARESMPVQSSSSTNDANIINGPVKSNSSGTTANQKNPFGRTALQALNGSADSLPRQPKDGNLSSGSLKKDPLGERREVAPSTASQLQEVKPSDSKLPSTSSSNNSVIGVYSSSSDPVHVPSPDSRQAAKREVGVVGAHRQHTETSKLSSAHSCTFSNSHLGREGSSRETLQSFDTLSKSDHLSQNVVPEPTSGITINRPSSNHQYNSRSHQIMGHQKAPQPSKEWKPKSSQKPSANGPGVIRMTTLAASPPVENSKDVGTEAAQLEDKMSQVDMSENQNVIIAAHIRVSDSDRGRLIFGSLGTDVETRKLGFQAAGNPKEPQNESSRCLSVSSAPASNEPMINKQGDLGDDQVRKSGSVSPPSVSVPDHQLTDEKEVSTVHNLGHYADIGLVHENSSSYVLAESQQQQDASELQSFSAYDPQSGYDISYFETTVEEPVRGQGLPSHQESINSHVANSVSSSIAMVQQQQQAVAQMYSQLHVPHYANLMPYRHFLSPVYVPPMAVPGYSSNATYPHPSNGSSYVLMPGTSSHLTASGLKYGIQPFKPVPTGRPTGFGNFTTPAGYAVNTPGVVGSAAGLEDSSRLKYKDGNLYVSNPQAETSEIWMNQRDLQSASYYSMPAQTPHASAYLPSHSGHASCNAAAAVGHSTHMQFPGLYHTPPQPVAIANAHHLGPGIGGNVGVGVGVAAAARGAQLGTYQQPQLGHLNWTGNF